MFFATCGGDVRPAGAPARPQLLRAGRPARPPAGAGRGGRGNHGAVAGAAAGYLKGLGTPLRYPVVADPTGRVADGYGVQDQPWFALTSAAGKVIWKHDGWLSVRALEAAAHRA